jgi:superfamily II helicase
MKQLNNFLVNIQQEIKKSKKTILLLVVLSLSLFFNFKSNRYVIVQTSDFRQDLLEQLLRIEQLQINNRILLDTLANIIKEREEIINKQSNITNKYVSIYNKIDNTLDSAQLAITYELLSKHREIAFERN